MRLFQLVVSIVTVLKSNWNLLSELKSCVKTEVAVLGSPSFRVLMVSVAVKQHLTRRRPIAITTQELCESRGEHAGLPVPNGPYRLCGSKTILKKGKKLLVSPAQWQCLNGHPFRPSRLAGRSLRRQTRQTQVQLAVVECWLSVALRPQKPWAY